VQTKWRKWRGRLVLFENGGDDSDRSIRSELRPNKCLLIMNKSVRDLSDRSLGRTGKRNARNDHGEDDHSNSYHKGFTTTFEYYTEILTPTQRFIGVLHRCECKGKENKPQSAEDHARRQDDPVEDKVDLPNPHHEIAPSESISAPGG
jgi:hypothetical protein